MQDHTTVQQTPIAPLPSPTDAVFARARELALADLKDLHARLGGLLAEREEAARAEALDAIKSLAADAGLSQDDVLRQLAPKPKRGRRGVVPPKFRDPETGATWSGRGKVPSWMKERMDRDGAKKEDFLIDPPGRKPTTGSPTSESENSKPE